MFVSIYHPNQGFGMIEVMIAMALLFMLSLGVTNLFTNMQKEQKRQSLIAFLTSKKTNFENAINNSKSWDNVLSNMSANMISCISAAPSNCAGVQVEAGPSPAAGSYTAAVLADADNRIVLRDGGPSGGSILPGFTGASNNGFTENGIPCNTFNSTPGSGVNDCPIGYIAVVVPQSSATHPKISVYVKMIFNGTTDAGGIQTHPFATFFNASISNLTFNDKYDVRIDRTAVSVNKSFTAISVIDTAGGGCATGGFGACASTGTYYDDHVEQDDPYDLISTSVSNITIREKGKYNCEVTTFSFRAGTTNSELRVDTGSWTTVASVTGFASVPTAGFSTNRFSANLNITTANTNVRIWQSCSAGGTVGADNSCQLGFDNSPYAANTARAFLNCTLLSD